MSPAQSHGKVSDRHAHPLEGTVSGALCFASPFTSLVRVPPWTHFHASSPCGALKRTCLNFCNHINRTHIQKKKSLYRHTCQYLVTIIAPPSGSKGMTSFKLWGTAPEPDDRICLTQGEKTQEHRSKLLYTVYHCTWSKLPMSFKMQLNFFPHV